MTVNGVTVNGVTVNGVTVNGVTVNGVTVNGVMVNGVTVNGVTVNGVTVNVHSDSLVYTTRKRCILTAKVCTDSQDVQCKVPDYKNSPLLRNLHVTTSIFLHNFRVSLVEQNTIHILEVRQQMEPNI